MDSEQLELDLWHSLETAARFPQTADFPKLCSALEREIAEQSVTEQLQVAGEVLLGLSQVYAARVELLLSAWERRYNPTEPVVNLEGCVDLFVQSLQLSVADLFEPPEPVQYPANRQSPYSVAPDISVVGLVEKALAVAVAEQSSVQRGQFFLDITGQPLNPTDPLCSDRPSIEGCPVMSGEFQGVAAEPQRLTSAELAIQVIQLAHSENIGVWANAIAQWLEQEHDDSAVCLVELQQRLGMPMVEVWLGLLLSGEQYEWEQRGDFYAASGIWLKRSSSSNNSSNATSHG